MSRPNFVNSMLLRSLKSINFFLVVAGHSSFYWNEHSQTMSVYGTNHRISLPIAISLFYCVLMTIYIIGGLVHFEGLLYVIWLVAIRWLLVTESLRSMVFDMVNAFKFTQDVLMVKNIFQWKHVLHYAFNIVTGLSTWPFKGQTDDFWLSVFVGIHFWVVPNLVFSTLYFGFLTSRVLYEKTNKEFRKHKFFGVSLQAMCSRTEVMLGVYGNLGRLVDGLVKYSQVWILTFLMFAIYPVPKVTKPSLLYALTTMVQFSQLLHFAMTADGWKTEMRRTLDIITAEDFNRNVEIIVLTIATQERSLNVFQMIEFNRKFLCKFFFVFVAWLLVGGVFSNIEGW